MWKTVVTNHVAERKTERHRETETETDRQTDRETDRQRDRQTEIKTDRPWECIDHVDIAKHDCIKPTTATWTTSCHTELMTSRSYMLGQLLTHTDHTQTHSWPRVLTCWDSSWHTQTHSSPRVLTCWDSSWHTQTTHRHTHHLVSLHAGTAPDILRQSHINIWQNRPQRQTTDRQMEMDHTETCSW